MPKHKIICTVTNDLTYDQRMIRICSSLSKADYEVLLVGRIRPQSIPIKKQSFQQKRLSCFFEHGKFFYLEYNIRLFFFLLFQNFDLVCSIDLDSILPGFLMSKLKGKIIVYDAHEYFTEVPEVIERPLIKKIWEKIAAFTIPSINYAYTVCESIGKALQKRYGTSFEIIRNVPFKKDLKQNEKHHPPIILYQGVLNDGRGLEESIQAMEGIENAALWLAGEGDLSNELRALVQEIKLQNKVKFLGYLRPQDLQKVTNQASIGLNLLQNKGLNYYFSLANKAFDYIQSEIPSINMNFPEYAILQKEYKPFYLLENLEIDHIQSAIKALLENKEGIYTELKSNCRKAKEELIWEKEEKKLIAFYHKIFETD